ncbi:MAG TPA: hypothetical protein VGI10_29135 [Polyangiaceae bacterium]
MNSTGSDAVDGQAATSRAGDFENRPKARLTRYRALLRYAQMQAFVAAGMCAAPLHAAPPAGASPVDPPPADAPPGVNLGIATVPDVQAVSSPPPAGGAAPPPKGQLRVGTWSLMADAQLQSIQLSDLTTSFGLGVAYRTLRTDTSIIIRKGTQSSLEGAALSADFGHFALDPAAANVGASFRGMYFVNSGRYLCKACDPVSTYPGLQVGLRFSVDVGQTQLKATLPDGTVDNEGLSAAAFTAGLVARVSDKFTSDGVERPIALGLYISAASHLVGGDLVAQERKDIFGNDALLYYGVEGGLFFQLASAEVTMKISDLVPNGDRVRGLTGFQLIPRVSFSLPFDIVQYDGAKPASGTASPDAAAGADGSAAAAGGTAQPTPPTPPAAATPATPTPPAAPTAGPPAAPSP